jgi:hypothetical protein
VIIRFLLLVVFLVAVKVKADDVNIDEEIIKNLEFYQTMGIVIDQDAFVKALLRIDIPAIHSEEAILEIERNK